MPSLLDVLGYAGNALDLPGSSVRDLLTGNNPFDQWLTPFSSDNRATGRDVLNPIFGANEETGMAGWLDNPMEGVKDVAGFGAEMLLDPTNLIPGRAILKALKGRKAAKATNKLIDAENLANAGRYGRVNAKVLMDDMLPEQVVNPMAERTVPDFYHGTTVDISDFEIPPPDVGSRRSVMGPAIYVSNQFDRAKSWATRNENSASLNPRVYGASSVKDASIFDLGETVPPEEQLRLFNLAGVEAGELSAKSADRVYDRLYANFKKQMERDIPESLLDSEETAGQYFKLKTLSTNQAHYRTNQLLASAGYDALKGGPLGPDEWAFINPKALKNNGVYDPVNPITGEAPQRLLGYTPGGEDPMFPGKEIMHHGGRDMSASATAQHPYGVFDLGRLKTGEGANMYSPGAYKADVEETSARYKKIIDDRDPEPNPIKMGEFRQKLDEVFTPGKEYTADELTSGPISGLGYAAEDMFERAGLGEIDGVEWAGARIKGPDGIGGYEFDLGVRKPDGSVQYVSAKDLQDDMGGAYTPEFDMPDWLDQFGIDMDYVKPAGRLYKYDVPSGTKDRFMKWEAPYGEQPQSVKRAFMQAELPESLADKRAYLSSENRLDSLRGEDMADWMMGNRPADATLADTAGLRAAGVPGMKNLAGSTNRTTYNYAIWDQDLLNSMRVREIDGVRVPINPTTLIQQQAVPARRGIADENLLDLTNPMREKMEVPNALKPVVAGAVFNLLARQNNYGGAL